VFRFPLAGPAQGREADPNSLNQDTLCFEQHPDFDCSCVRLPVKIPAIKFAFQPVAQDLPGRGRAVVDDGPPGAADDKPMPSMGEHGAALVGYGQAGEAFRQIGEIQHLHAAPVINVACSIAILQNTTGLATDPAEDMAELGHERLLLGRHTGRGTIGITLGKTCSQGGRFIFYANCCGLD
jgi:hypothetical protein